MPPHRRKEVEDPDNTWNRQLMEAVLVTDLPACQSLVAKGADPVKAREAVSFTRGGLVSPLAALLLRGVLDDKALAVAQYLMTCGASLDDVMPLPEPPHPASHAGTNPQGEEAATRNGGRQGTGGPDPSRSQNTHSNSAATSRSPSRGGEAPAPKGEAAGTATTTTAVVVTAEPVATPSPQRARRAHREEGEETPLADCGTLMHYVVALGDHAHLLQLLMVLAEHMPAGPPQSLLAEVEREMSLPPPVSSQNGNNSTTEGGGGKGGGAGGGPNSPGMPSGSRSGRSRSRAASSSRRQSRSAGPDRRAQQQQQQDADLAAAAGRRPLVPSPLPLLEQYPYKPPAHEPATAAALSANGAEGQQRASLLSRSPIRLLPPLNAPAAGRQLRTTVDLEVRTSRTGQTALEMAMERKDVLAVRLLTYYGAEGFAANPRPSPTLVPTTAEAVDTVEKAARACVNGYVNGTQTLLARACSLGDIATAEALLDAGDSLTQLSYDGRYTLMHYAAGQPLMLQYLVRRGLSAEVENAFGESALVSLIRHGTGRNADHARKEAPCMSDATKLAALPACVLRNYILTPLPPLLVAATGKGAGAKDGGLASSRFSISGGGGRAASRAAIAHAPQQQPPASLESAADAEANVIGGGQETGTFFSFTSLPTADLIHNLLLHARSSINGTVPDEELDLAYVRFAEEAEEATESGSGGLHGASSHSPSSSENGAKKKNKQQPSSSSSDPRAWATAAAKGETLSPTASEPGNNVGGGAVRTSTAALQPARLPLRAPPLIHAIVNYHPELIRKFVVEYRADVMGRDSQGACALHYAAQSPHTSIMEFLLSPLVLGLVTAATSPATATSPQAGAATAATHTAIDVNVCDMSGRTPLHYAAAVGNVSTVKLLLAMGSTTLRAGKPDNNGYTPLHLAVLANSADCVEALVRHSETVMTALCGVSTSTATHHGTSSFAFSGNGGSFSTTKRGGGGGGGGGGASPASSHSTLPTRNRRSSVASSSSARGTGNNNNSNGGAYQDGFAMAFGPNGMNEWCVVDTETEDRVEHATALEMAVKKKADPAIVHLLMSEGSASYHRPSGLPNGGSLLHRAVADDEAEYVALLLAQYADPNEVDGNDDTPLMLALDRPSDAVRVDIVQGLLKYGALPNAQSAVTLKTPLHIAAERGHAEEVLATLFFEVSGAWSTAEFSAENPYASHSAPRGGGGGGGGASASPTEEARNSTTPTTISRGGAVARRLKERLQAAQQGPADPLTPSSVPTHATPTNSGLQLQQQRLAKLSRRPIPEPHFFLVDSKGRTPFQLLCGQSDPAKQANALLVLRALLLPPSSGAPTADTSFASAAAEGGGVAMAHSSLPTPATHALAARGTAKKKKAAKEDDEGGFSDFARRLCLWADASGRLPLHNACRAGFSEAVELLLAVQPSTVFYLAGDGGSTALHEAVSACYFSSESRTFSHPGSVATPAAADRESDGVGKAARQSRMQAIFAAIERAVTAATLPTTLSGYAASSSCVKGGSNSSKGNAVSRGSITAQLRSRSSLLAPPSPPLAKAAATRTSTSHSPVVSSWEQYLALTDIHGRTAFLIAGERGDIAASSALMKLSGAAAATTTGATTVAAADGVAA